MPATRRDSPQPRSRRFMRLTAWLLALVIVAALAVIGFFYIERFESEKERDLEAQTEQAAAMAAARYDRSTLAQLARADLESDDPLIQYVQPRLEALARQTGMSRIFYFRFVPADQASRTGEGSVLVADSRDRDLRRTIDARIATDQLEIERCISSAKPTSTIFYGEDPAKADHRRAIKVSYALVPPEEGSDDRDTFVAGVEFPVSYLADVEQMRLSLLGVLGACAVFVLMFTWVATAAFKRLDQQLERQRRKAQLADFSAGIAHEIKNPLAAMRTMLQLMEKKAGDGEKRLIHRLEREVLLLDQIVKDFLSLARGAQRSPEPTTAGDVVTRIRDQLTEFQDACLAIEGDMSTKLVVDKTAVTQAVANLVKNACQAALAHHKQPAARAHQPEYSSTTTGRIHEQLGVTFAECGGARVSLTFTTPGSRAVFVVADNGPGVSDAVRDRLFEPFVSDREGGTGLGLSICRRLAEDMGGRVVLATSSSEGSVFRLEIPREAKETDA